MIALFLLAALPVSATPPAILRQDEELVARSVVEVERRTRYRAGAIAREMVNFGTAVVIGEQTVDGRREYLLLSNEHVAHNHHVRGRSTLYIVQGSGVRSPIRVEALAVDARRDQALLRTAGCDVAFPVPRFVIGPPPEDVKRDTSFTVGYGNGRFSTLAGDILSTTHEDWGLDCYELDRPVGGGQSGAPLVVIGTDRRLYLPALVFCGTSGYTDATPLDWRRGVLRKIAKISIPLQ